MQADSISHMTLLVALRVFTSSTDKMLARHAIIPPIPTWATLSDPAEFVDWAYHVTDRLRTVSLLLTIIMFIMYDRYHQATVKHRWAVPGGRLGVQSADRSLRPFPIACFE